MFAYFRSAFLRRSVLWLGGPPIVVLVVAPLLAYLVNNYTWFGTDLSKIGSLVEWTEKSQDVGPWVLILTLVWLLVGTFWFGYKYLNTELETRDVEDVKRTPRTRLDRSYRLIHQLIVEGEKLINNGGHPDDIARWDLRVQTVLSDWCSPDALYSYMGYARMNGREPLNGKEALAHLSQIHQLIENYQKW